MLRHLSPDICLCAATSPWAEQKPSFDLLMEHIDATVELAAHDHIIEAEKITFRLASLERVSPTMLDWLRERLEPRLNYGAVPAWMNTESNVPLINCPPVHGVTASLDFLACGGNVGQHSLEARLCPKRDRRSVRILDTVSISDSARFGQTARIQADGEQ